jgi:PAS domain S-box-containing protein
MADGLFRDHQVRNYERTDHLFAFLLFVQWLLGIVASLIVSPLSWEGTVSTIHLHVYAAIFLGGAITALPLFLIKFRPGHVLTRHTIAVSQMLFSCLFIDIAGGRIETHFHVFGSLAVLAFYRDWRILVTASMLIGADHLVRGTLWPQSVFGTPLASPWRAIEHIAWVLFEDTFLCLGIKQNVQEMREIANQTAMVDTQVTLTNTIVSREVEARTKRLRASEQEASQLAAIVQQSDDAIMRLGLDGTIHTWNRGACRLFGFSEREMIGSTGHAIGLDFVSQAENAILQPILGGGSIEGWETVWRKRNGDKINVSLTLSPIKGVDGTLEAASLIVRDITQKKLVEKRISEFYSVVSHELRTPLTSIRGALSLIADGIVEQSSGEATELIQIARKSTIRLVRLINDILDLRKIEAGKFELDIRRVNVADLVAQSADDMLGFAEERHVKLEVKCEVEGDLELDRDRIIQVLSNLLSNAIKYSPEAGTVFLRCQQVGAAVRFEVVDHGAGIPAEMHDRLFGKFQQIDSSDSRAKEGSGLGLAVSKAIIEQHGGRIGFASERGEPTKFWFEIPASSLTEQEVSASYSAESEKTPPAPIFLTQVELEDSREPVRTSCCAFVQNKRPCVLGPCLSKRVLETRFNTARHCLCLRSTYQAGFQHS